MRVIMGPTTTRPSQVGEGAIPRPYLFTPAPQPCRWEASGYQARRTWTAIWKGSFRRAWLSSATTPSPVRIVLFNPLNLYWYKADSDPVLCISKGIKNGELLPRSRLMDR